MRTTLLTWVLPLAFMLVPALARAQDAPQGYAPCDHQPSESDIQAAKGAFQAGQVSFDEADYQRAITYWEDAYRRDCTAHALLLNLSRAYELSGDKQRAVVALETYIQRNPNANDMDKIKRRVDVLKSQLEAERPAQPTPVATTTPNAPGTPARPAPPPGQATPPPDTGTRRSVVPLFVVGGGAVLSLASLIPYINATKDVSHYEDLCGGRKCSGSAVQYIDAANSARNRQTLWGTMTLVGAGVAVGGLVWYFVQTPTPRTGTARSAPPHPRLSPALGPGYAGLVIDGNF